MCILHQENVSSLLVFSLLVWLLKYPLYAHMARSTADRLIDIWYWKPTNYSRAKRVKCMQRCLGYYLLSPISTFLQWFYTNRNPHGTIYSCVLDPFCPVLTYSHMVPYTHVFLIHSVQSWHILTLSKVRSNMCYYGCWLSSLSCVILISKNSTYFESLR